MSKGEPHYQLVGHAETLSSGRRIAPGDEPIPESAVDLEADKHLIDDGRLIKVEQPTEKAVNDKETSR